MPSYLPCGSRLTPFTVSGTTPSPRPLPRTKCKGYFLTSPKAAPSTASNEALVAAARQEATVTYWGTQGAQAGQFLVKFKEKYPFLEVKALQLTDTEQIERVIAE